MDNVQKETHVVSVMTNKYKETCPVVRDEKDDRLLTHQIRRERPTKGREKSSKTSGNREEISSDTRREIRCRHQNCHNRHENLSILQCVKLLLIGCLIESILDPKIRIKYIDTKNQHADRKFHT